MWEFLTSFFNSGAGLQYWSNDLGRPGLGWLSLCLFFRYVFTVSSKRIRRVFTFLTRRHGRSCAVLFVAKDLWWQLLESRDGRWVKYSLGHSRRNLYYGRQLLLLPYITLVCWCTGSIVVSLLPLKKDNISVVLIRLSPSKRSSHHLHSNCPNLSTVTIYRLLPVDKSCKYHSPRKLEISWLYGIDGSEWVLSWSSAGC